MGCPARRDARGAPDVGRQLTDQQLRPEGRAAQLGVSQVQVVGSFSDVIGELVGQREAEPERRAVRCDDIDACELRLLACVSGKIG